MNASYSTNRIATMLCLVVCMSGCRPAADEAPIVRSASVAPEVLPTMVVYKSPTCGCCSKWVDHLRGAGMDVKVTDTEDMASIKERFGVPRTLSSCHTAIVGGYIVEGHVPAADIQRMLTTRPDAAGLAVPGMPIGSPGMEVDGRPADAYNVVLFDANGNQKVFASH